MDDASVLERSGATIANEVVASNLKNILLHVQNDGAMEDRLQAALAIARATGGHLRCLQVTPIEAYVSLEAFGILGLDKAMQKVDLEEDQLRTRIERHLATEDVSWDYEAVAGYAAPELIRNAALSDLVIVGRNAHSALVQRPEISVLGDIIKGIRTPILVPGPETKAIDPFGTAVVAWNGSFEAANAVRAAIDLLKLASDVRVIRCTEDKEAMFPDTRLTAYLSRHEVHAELDVRPVRRDYSDDLVEYASLHDASYIVMGGYGHSRAGEFLFGGVTRELLRECPISLVIGH